MPTSVYLAYEGDEEPPPSIVRAARRVAQRLGRGPRPEQIVAGGAVEVSPAPRIARVAAMASLDGLPPRPLGPDESANHDYVANIRDAIHQLVNIEMKLGSDELAPLALRYLRAARRRLDQRQYELSVERELQAALSQRSRPGSCMTLAARTRPGRRATKLSTWPDWPAPHSSWTCSSWGTWLTSRYSQADQARLCISHARRSRAGA